MNIRDCLQERILILDGAMGTLIQQYGLDAQMFHGSRFAAWPVSLQGNNDVLNLTAPDVIADIHRRYIEAGADIISTNTFSSNRISQLDYGCAELVREMAYEGARIARSVADAHCPDRTARPIFVAGSMGPTSKSLTLAGDISRPAERAVSFDDMSTAYAEQAEALIEGGADLLLLETCFDALNTKAALYAIQQLNRRLGRTIPVMVSATINDRSGRVLTGQTLEAFYISVSHYPILSFGLNCSFGVQELAPIVERIARRLPVYISVHPNAGLPNEMGEYEELPAFTAHHLRKMAQAGLLNIAGGCCGTDDSHIRAISEALQGVRPRRVPTADYTLTVSGLEPLRIERFTNIGERTNVAGSRKFARLIAGRQYDEALSVARQQIEGGASIIDINMDDAMLDSRKEMQTFVRHIANDPSVGRAVLMIDSSDWPTVLSGLKNATGKCVVNSISLKGGEEAFIEKARQLRQLGAAVVVMAFDEEGQATTYDRKTAIAQRAYSLLTGMGFPPQDIIFDVNILSVGTGISEHAAYGIDFIRAVAWIKQHLPLAKTSGGVSNLSFAFRGNNKVREAMHSVFLYHAVKAGLDMAIVNPSMLQVYDDIEPQLLEAVEAVVMNTSAAATDRLIALADRLRQQQNAAEAGQRSDGAASGPLPSWRTAPVEERLSYALTKGVSDYLAEDLPEVLHQLDNDPVRVIEGPLMHVMEHVGRLFGEGKMFLPQVVKTAKVMKDAVTLLQPLMEKSAASGQRPKIVIATANGDVHDIGKNIVGMVLACNGFEVHDLGVMVSNETILAETLRLKPMMVGVSGLITPSLKEMEDLCRLFQRHRLQVPVNVGGATTSAVHTAVKLAPLYDGGVIFGGDASQTAVIAKRLQMDREGTLSQLRTDQQQIRNAWQEHHAELTAYDEANRLAPRLPYDHSRHPSLLQLQQRDAGLHIDLSGVVRLIDWRMFLLFWGFKGETLQQQLVNPEAARTMSEGKRLLEQALDSNTISLRLEVRHEAAVRRGNDIILSDGTCLPMLRSQTAASHYLSLADYFHPAEERPIGLFAIVSRPVEEPADEEARLMTHALCARMAEAAAEWLQQQLYADGRALRVAFGYATCPDHSLKRIVFDRLEAEQRLGITLTDHYSIQPSTAVCGLFIAHDEARYFPVGRIDMAQLSDYCRRRGITTDEGKRLLSKYLKEK